MIPTTISHLRFTVPIVALLAVATGAASAWIANEKEQVALGIRVDVADHRIELLQTQLHEFVPGPEFAMALADLKRELDEVQTDVREIRQKQK